MSCGTCVVFSRGTGSGCRVGAVVVLCFLSMLPNAKVLRWICCAVCETSCAESSKLNASTNPGEFAWCDEIIVTELVDPVRWDWGGYPSGYSQRARLAP